jgi:hypothetical protein
MGLAGISPDNRGFEARTFECGTCHRTTRLFFAVDPMKSAALGWLAASELKPPR